MSDDAPKARAPSDHSVFDTAVVGIDERESALDALALLKRLVPDDGEAWLVYVELVDDKPWASSAEWRAEMRGFALKRLEMLRDEARIVGEVACVEARSIRRGLHEFAGCRGADLLVVGASRRDEVTRELLGDGTREVLEDPPCAVAVAPAGYCLRAGALSTIGVAYDGSRGSDRALTLARRLGAEHGAAVSAFRAVKARCCARESWRRGGETDEEVARARNQLAALGGVELHAEFANHRMEALTRYEASVDLLVIGPHRYTPIDRFLQRTTSQRLAAETACPLLVLPAAGRMWPPTTLWPRALRDDRD